MLATLLCLAGSFGLWWGAQRIAVFSTALSADTPFVAEDSGLFALPLLGWSLLSIGVMLAMRRDRPRVAGLLFAGFLLAGTGAIAALLLGPALLGQAAAIHGYHACASNTGVRTTRALFAFAGTPCDRAVRGGRATRFGRAAFLPAMVRSC